MTSSQTLTTSSGSDRQNRDSFSDRICDDLCEVILQYLSLEDKLKHEFVSEQFRRTIFQKHFELIFYEDVSFPVMKNEVELLKKAEHLLKRCPNIKLVEIVVPCGAHSFIQDFNYNEFIDLIIKYCNNLVDFKCDFIQMSETTFTEFSVKFGSKLKAIKTIYKKKELSLLSAFLKLEKLDLNGFLDRQLTQNISAVELKGIKSLSACYMSDKYFKDLILKFKTLRHLSLNFGDFGELNDQYFPHISSLKHLIKLEIFGDIIPLNDKSVFNHLKQMSDNCPKLKSLYFEFILDDFTSELFRLFSAIKAFKQLKRLNLFFEEPEEEEYYDKPKDITEMFSFEALECLTNITHLNLIFSNHFANEKMFTNIDINLPNVEKMEIGITLKTTPEGTTLVADILSRLSKLKSFKLYVSDKTIKKNLSKQLAQKCKRIATIDLITRIAPE